MEQIIYTPQDLTHLSWSKIRGSSGTAGSFLKAQETTPEGKTYYKLSDYDSFHGVTGHESVNEIIADRMLTILDIPHLSYQLIHADIIVDEKPIRTWLCASRNFRQRGEKKDALDDPVTYESTDSMIWENGGYASLYGDSKVSYQNVQLTAAVIKMQMDSSLVYADGVRDSTGEWIGMPVFVDGSTPYESNHIRYNFKTEKVSYKVKTSVLTPEKELIFENTHEPIIDRATWERVQELRKQRKRPNRYDEMGLFSGLVFCADCGSVMYQQRYDTPNRKQDCYICGSYKKRTADCTAHFVRTDALIAGVTANLKAITKSAQTDEQALAESLLLQSEDGTKQKTAAIRKEMDAAEKRLVELKAIFKRLYEDSVRGQISAEQFTDLATDYEQERSALKAKIAELEAAQDKTKVTGANVERFMAVVRKYRSFEELTPTLLREFVEKIVVHESVALDGKRHGKQRTQVIEIFYRFIGKVDAPR